jgi:sulfate adenylyltransferase subunit 1
VIALPSGRRTHIRRIVTFDGDLKVAHAPLSVTLTLEDEIDIGRGDMIAGGDDPQAARTFEAAMVWFDARPLDEARDYLVKHTAHTVPARVERVRHRVNVATLETEPALRLAMNEVGVVRIATSRPIFFDRYAANRGTGSFILIDRETNATAGAGMILSAVEDTVENAADRLARLVRNLVPAGAQLNLPAEENAAAEVLRKRLEGVWE